MSELRKLSKEEFVERMLKAQRDRRKRAAIEWSNYVSANITRWMRRRMKKG